MICPADVIWASIEPDGSPNPDQAVRYFVCTMQGKVEVSKSDYQRLVCEAKERDGYVPKQAAQKTRLERMLRAQAGKLSRRRY